jgi:hypothetical protein
VAVLQERAEKGRRFSNIVDALSPAVGTTAPVLLGYRGGGQVGDFERKTEKLDPPTHYW